jgi:hypothetical protein
MHRITYAVLLALFSAFLCACSLLQQKEDPKNSVGQISTKPAEKVWKRLVALSADDDLSEMSRKACLTAAAAESAGSGFVVSGHTANGKSMLVTNRHVVENSDHPHISFDDGQTIHVADILYVDGEYDLAVLLFKGELPGLKLQTEYANSDEVSALGYPVQKEKGKFQTTSGVISDPCIKGRDIENEGTASGDACWIKHTAQFDPGSSGGPLITKSKTAVGVNTGFLPNLHDVFLAVPAKAVAEALKRAEEILEHEDDREWRTEKLKDACRRFMSEAASVSANAPFLKSALSHELVAEYGYEAYGAIVVMADFEGARYVIKIFANDPLEAFRGSLVISIRAMFRRGGGLAADEKCERVNPNDDVMKPDANVRIMVSRKDGQNIEFTWVYHNGWYLRDFNAQ